MPGRHFEDFMVGQDFHHAIPRTLDRGEAALYIALTGSRHMPFSSHVLASELGYADRPLDDLLVFNVAFGKTVPDVSANAIANLGYADVRFLRPVMPGDTLRAESTVIGLRQTTDGKKGVVYVRSIAFDQRDEPVLTWIRWVMIPKTRPGERHHADKVPDLPAAVPAEMLSMPPIARIGLARLCKATGSDRLWDDFEPGMRIRHPAGMTINESDHTLATRLYQNTAHVHFDARAMAGTPHGRRLVYGGHIISLCRALSFDGLENVLAILAINGGSHRAPSFAGDTIYAFTEVMERIDLPGRSDIGALRLRLVGLKDRDPAELSDRATEGDLPDDLPVVLDFDYVVAMPRRR